MNSIRRIISLLCVLASAGFSLFSQARLDAASFEGPIGRYSTVLRISDQGRYALIAEGEAASGMSLVDRMYGTVASGSGDGKAVRLEAFLEPGEYEVRLEKSRTGPVKLSQKEFLVVNSGKDRLDVPLLEDEAKLVFELEDFQAMSFWVKADSVDDWIIAGMAGRNLAGAALFREGIWDTGLRPLSSQLVPEKGRELSCLEYCVSVEPGFYLLTLWGGPQRTWAKESKKNPLFVEKSAVYLGEMGSVELLLGESGRESFLVSGKTTMAQIIVPRQKECSIGFSSFGKGMSRSSYNISVSVRENDLSRIGTVYGNPANERKWLTVWGTPGETIRLRFFPLIRDSAIRLGSYVDTKMGGEYSLALGGSYEGRDSFDLSALVLEWVRRNNAYSTAVLKDFAVALDPSAPLRRRSNGTGRFSFLMRTADTGDYVVQERDSKTGSASYSFILIDDYLQGNSRSQNATAGKKVSLLGGKYYLVYVDPLVPGMNDFAVLKSGLDAVVRAKAEFLKSPPVSVNSLFWSGFRYDVDPTKVPYILSGGRSEAPSGISVRALPVDLSEPFCIPLAPGEAAMVRVSLPYRGRLQSILPSGVVEAKLDTRIVKDSEVFEGGSYNLSLSNRSGEEAWPVMRLKAEKARRASAVSPAEWKGEYGVFTLGEPSYGEWARSETKRFLLEVSEPGMYSVETTGRLAMSLRLRPPLRTSLLGAETNWAGRNARFAAYLKPGKYSVEARSLGLSRGSAGLIIKELPISGIGTLESGGLLRTTVKAESAVWFGVNIDKEDTYILSPIGLGLSFSYRFENSGGWPVFGPTGAGEISARLAPGKYRYFSLPEAVATRRLFQLKASRISGPESADAQGKNREEIRLNIGQSFVWEKARGREDVRAIKLPAPVEAVLLLDDTMFYRVIGPDGKQMELGLGGKPVALRLEPGRTEFRCRPGDERDRIEYGLALISRDLYDGSSVNGNPGERFPITIGEKGEYEIWSFGGMEVAAELYTEPGERLVSSEPIQDDWNFRILASLEKGRYFLLLKSPGSIDEDLRDEPRRIDTAQEGYGTEEYGEQSYGYLGEGGQSYGYLDESEYGGEVPEASRGDADQESALNLEPPSGPILVSMRMRKERVLPVRQGEFTLNETLAGETARLRFSPKISGVYKFAASSSSPVSLELSKGGRRVAGAKGSLVLPLRGGTEYELKFWSFGEGPLAVGLGSAIVAASEMSLGKPSAAKGDSAPGMPEPEESISSALSLVKLEDPSRLSRSFSAKGGLLYSPGFELPFASIGDEAVRSSSGESWIMSEDGNPLGAIRIAGLVFRDGGWRSLEMGSSGQSFHAYAAPKTVLVLESENSGTPMGLAALKSGSSLYEWSGGISGTTSSLTAIREGYSPCLFWDPSYSPDEPPKTAGLEAKSYPVAAEEKLASGFFGTLEIPPASARAFLPEAQAASYSLIMEKGLLAFAWDGSPSSFLSALDSTNSGEIGPGKGSLVIVNMSEAKALCRIESGVARSGGDSVLTEASSIEKDFSAEGVLKVKVDLRNPDLAIFAAGEALSLKFFDSVSGRARNSVRIDSSIDSLMTLEASKGILEVRHGKGAFKVWAAPKAGYEASFFGGIGKNVQTLPAGGGALTNSGQAWEVEVGNEAYYLIEAEGGGICLLSDSSGKILRGIAGSGRASFLAKLGRGRYTIATRPLESVSRSGTLRAVPLSPVEANISGESKPDLIGPGGKALYKFTLGQKCKVGIGFRAESETLEGSLLDEDMRLLGKGSIFVRTLEAGSYFLLIESAGSSQKYAFVAYGLEGNLRDVPDEVKNAYRSDEE